MTSLSPQAPAFDVTGCTIISKNYLSYARVLADSFKEHHPNSRFVVLLCDRVDGYFDPSKESFELMEVERLGIPDFAGMAARYSILELNTAVKPFFLKRLLDESPKVAYFDPDILITSPLLSLQTALREHDIVLTPHMMTPVDDGKLPNERTMLQAGAYNLGFIALRRSDASSRLLSWWKERLCTQCYARIEDGLFVDQKWMDLAPSYFPEVHLWRDAACNVAYWNLHERRIATSDGRCTVNGQPLAFFHFSGYEPHAPHRVSAHQNRVRFEQHPELVPLFDLYREKQLKAGYEECRAWPYAFDRLNGNTARSGKPRLARPAIRAWLRRRHRWEPYQRCIRFLKRIIGLRAFYALKGISGTVTRSSAPALPLKWRTHICKTGVNVVGHVTGELGIGQAVRGHIKALDAAGVPLSIHDVEIGESRRDDRTYAGRFATDAPYDISLIEVNAETLPVFQERSGNKLMDGKYCIGHWAWEMQSFPQVWFDRFDMLQEIWVASSYVQQGLSLYSPIPVITMPYVVAIDPPRRCGRAHFSLPEDRFLFLFLFDFLSVFQRKNPLGLIQAFRQAFTRDEPVQLALKFSNSDRFPAEQKTLRKAAGGDPRITLFDGYLSSAETADLLAACDAYVSLHRSEGFGLTMAEAMTLGKPVVGTGYSGNTDFLREDTGFPVRFRLTNLTKAHGPYPAGSEWADPDIDDAARLMRFIFEHPEEASRRGENGSAFIRAQYSADAIGRRVSERISTLRLFG